MIQYIYIRDQVCASWLPSSIIIKMKRIYFRNKTNDWIWWIRKSCDFHFSPTKSLLFQGEFTVKLEISNVSQLDKGSYKLVAKNEKGEATSQQVEITDIPEEKGDKPQIIKHFRSLVSN